MENIEQKIVIDVLLNDVDIAEYLAKIYFRNTLSGIGEPSWEPLERLIYKKRKQARRDDRSIEIDLSSITQAVSTSLQVWKDNVNSIYKRLYRPFVNFLSSKIDTEHFSKSEILRLIHDDQWASFPERIARSIDVEYRLVERHGYVPSKKTPLLIRNIINNENIITDYRRRRLPFWFVDSGYTNFLHPTKAWHRLVYNNIHHVLKKKQVFPADRLAMFPVFPEPWRPAGGKILVIESSEMHYRLHDDDIDSWRHRVKSTISKYSNRKVEFRPKDLNKKTRTSLYEYLKNQDIYCVISDSSAASIESIWCGIPVITLRPHISSSIGRWDLGEINNLYREDIGNWLCALSYSQFSKEEMCDGTAIECMRRYHGY